MSKIKYKSNLNKYCLYLLGLIIVSGCASQTKREKMLSIQKVRIQKLERQLDEKNKVIANMKMHKWAQAPDRVAEEIAFKPLLMKMKNNQWVSALSLSGELKKKYPQSVRLAKYRIAIFKKMGLNKQAIEETNAIRKQLSKRNRKTDKIR